MLRRVSVSGASNHGIWVSTNNGKFIDITVTNNGWEGLKPTGWYNEIRNITAQGNRTGIAYGAGQQVLIENVLSTGNSATGLLCGATFSTIRNITAADNGQHGVDTGDNNLLQHIVVRHSEAGLPATASASPARETC